MSDSQSMFERRPIRQWLMISVVVVLIFAVATWFYATRSPIADYVPLILVFLLAMAAIPGKSWDDRRQGFSRLTLTGRVIVILALLGLVGGIRNTQINHAKLADNEKVRQIAYRQLVDGISMILFPITSSWGEPPTNDIEILAKAQGATTIDALAKTRIVPFLDPAEDLMAMIQDPRLFSVSASGTRVASRCGVPHGGFLALYELFDFCINSGESKIKEARQTFLSQFAPKTIQLLHDIQDDEFYTARYRNLAQHKTHYYQGLRDEAGEDLATGDRTWQALVILSRKLLPRTTDEDTSGPHDKPSPWLYLGTHYFGHGQNFDSAAYKTFIEKVDTFVKHVRAVTNQVNLIDTFRKPQP